MMGVKPKPPIIEAFVDVKPSIEACVEAKSSGVSKLLDNEVNTASFFSTKDRRRVREDMLGWVHRQASKVGFTR